MGPDCAFCGIASSAAAVNPGIVLDEPEVVAFLDIRPVFKGHVLVMPRAHHVTFPDLPDDLLRPLFSAAQRVARAVVVGTSAQGTFVGMNNVVSQSVAHLHVHVVPRTKGDGLRGFFWPRTSYADADELTWFARRIRDAMP